MKPRFVTLILAVLGSACAGGSIAAEPLPAEAMGRVQITSPTMTPCKQPTDQKEEGCAEHKQLNELTNKSIKETLTTDPLPVTPAPPAQHLPQGPDVTPQQQQIMDDFTHRPWGR